MRNSETIFIGSYTTDGGLGIHTFSINLHTGDLGEKREPFFIENPSFFVLCNTRPFMYVVNESGNNLDSISCINLSADNSFNLVNKVYCGGSSPCYLSLDEDSKYLFTANYSDGSFSITYINDDGSLSDKQQIVRHSIGSNVHSILLTQDKKFLLVTDLGLDQLFIYNFSEHVEDPVLEVPYRIFTFPENTGPRHIIFSKDRKFIYVIGEYSGIVYTLAYDAGEVYQVQAVSIMPTGFNGTHSAAEIALTEDNKFLYVSNRGDANSISTFDVDPKSGIITLIDIIDTKGAAPRNFAMTTNNDYLIVANQLSNDLSVFKRKTESGILSYTKNSVKIDSPVFVYATDTDV